MNQSEPGGRKAAVAFILITLFIDILGIGIVVPVLPKLVQQLATPSEELSEIDEATAAGLESSVESFAETVDPTAEAAAGLNEFLIDSADDVRSTDRPAGRAGSDDPDLAEDNAESFSRAGLYVGLISSSYALMQFLFAPFLGALSDRFGRRPVLLFSLFFLGIDFVIQGLAPNLWWLFVGRIIAGIMGANFSTANAYIADVSNDETRARNFGLVGAMFGLGFTIGPALGGLLSGFVHPRSPFFVAAGLALINCAYGYFVLPESLPPHKRSRFRWAQANPFATGGLLRQYPIVFGLAVVVICKSLAQRGLENVWVLYTSYRYGWEYLGTGLSLALVGVMAVIVQGGMVRPVINRLGERRTVILGSVMAALSFLGYATATQGWMILLVIMVGALAGLAPPATQSLIAGAVDDSIQGKIQGSLTSLISLTNVVSPLFFNTFLFSYFISPRSPVHLPGAPFYVGFVVLVIATLVAWQVFRRIPESTPASSPPSDTSSEAADSAQVGSVRSDPK